MGFVAGGGHHQRWALTVLEQSVIVSQPIRFGSPATVLKDLEG
jgi:hypothetical protein